MSENLHLVFSKPPEDISDEAYNQWYDFHLGEILVVPGFVSARRYRLDTIKGGWTPSGHRYLSAYEIEGEPKEVMAELDKEVASGRMKLPEWFPQITFAQYGQIPMRIGSIEVVRAFLQHGDVRVAIGDRSTAARQQLDMHGP